MSAKNIGLLVVFLILIGVILFSVNNSSEKSETIDKLERMNQEYNTRDSIRQIKIDSLSSIQRDIRVERDTLYIYIDKTDAKTRKNIARIDSTPVMQLVRELSDRY